MCSCVSNRTMHVYILKLCNTSSFDHSYVTVCSTSSTTHIHMYVIYTAPQHAVEKKMCFLCDSPASVRFQPCGHLDMCSQCAARAKKCPTCRVSLVVTMAWLCYIPVSESIMCGNDLLYACSIHE